MIWIQKSWGGEEIIVNCDQYCGKILHFIKGKSCSFHYHAVKKETFYVLEGRFKVYYFDDISVARLTIEKLGYEHFKEHYAQQIILEKNDTFEIHTGRIHQMVALENSKLLEVSTTDKAEDSIRLVKGD